jgi:hypothetical protein
LAAAVAAAKRERPTIFTEGVGYGRRLFFLLLMTHKLLDEPVLVVPNLNVRKIERPPHCHFAIKEQNSNMVN